MNVKVMAAEDGLPSSALLRPVAVSERETWLQGKLHLFWIKNNVTFLTVFCKICHIF